MIEFQLKTKAIEEENSIVTALETSDLSDRKGYDKDFLGVTLKLPNAPKNKKNAIGKNPNPGVNGENYLDYTHFSILFNKKKKLPILTAVNIDGKTNELGIIHETRDDDAWNFDKRLKDGKKTNQFGDDDYARSGFQKGHMVRYYDPAWGDSIEIKMKAINDTFYYTNCCPQLRYLNSGDWLNLEDYAIARAIFQDEKVTVFSGPIFKNAMQVGKLLVPVNFWKIIVYRKKNKIEAIGFLLSQQIIFEKMVLDGLMIETDKKYSKPTLKKEDIERLFDKKNLKGYVVPIKKIEEKTGLKFGLNTVDYLKKKEVNYFEKLGEDNFTTSSTKNSKIADNTTKLRDSSHPHFDDEAFIKNI